MKRRPYFVIQIKNRVSVEVHHYRLIVTPGLTT